jgi:hypothetical protein
MLYFITPLRAPMFMRKTVFLSVFVSFFERPRSRRYGRTAALRLIVQPCDEDEEKDDQFFLIFPSNGTPVE